MLPRIEAMLQCGDYCAAESGDAIGLTNDEVGNANSAQRSSADAREPMIQPPFSSRATTAFPPTPGSARNVSESVPLPLA